MHSLSKKKKKLETSPDRESPIPVKKVRVFVLPAFIYLQDCLEQKFIYFGIWSHYTFVIQPAQSPIIDLLHIFVPRNLLPLLCLLSIPHTCLLRIVFFWIYHISQSFFFLSLALSFPFLLASLLIVTHALKNSKSCPVFTFWRNILHLIFQQGWFSVVSSFIH